MRKGSAIFFDFDGTIVDSERIIGAFMKKTFAHFGVAYPSLNLGSRGLPEAIRAATPEATPPQQAEMIEYAKARSLETLSDIGLIEGAYETLALLTKDYRLAMVTSRGRSTTEMLLERHTLGKFFEIVVTRDEVSASKPDPEGILLALNSLRVPAGSAVYVGDAPADIQAAQAACVHSILISKGTEDYGADDRIEVIAQLPALLQRLKLR
ncbi:MAG: HAD family hydrolase [Patescibacteria group bacterium]|nr:HAD family hydrolase [Patescibacteria group bacterium]